jgi:uncharacterized protein YndB with AHSA1/START domain
MSAPVETRTVTVEREFAHPAERIWRALTQPHLIAEWLMANDFVPEVGHRFGFKAEWGDLDCEVLEIEPERSLAYRWAGLGLDSVVTWTLTPMDGGTRLTMVQTGFLPEQKLAYHGARAGWPRFLDRLETVLAGLD